MMETQLQTPLTLLVMLGTIIYIYEELEEERGVHKSVNLAQFLVSGAFLSLFALLAAKENYRAKDSSKAVTLFLICFSALSGYAVVKIAAE